MKQLFIRQLFLYIFTIAACIANGQTENLVYNGSFEKYSKCPDNFGMFAHDQRVYGWSSPTNGTPDFFHSCSDKSGVPRNWVGYAEPFDGKGYMGIIACMEQIDPNQIAYREYLSTKLKEPLDSGKTYYLSFRTMLGISCNTACNGLGAFFSRNNIKINASHNIPVKPDVVLKGDPVIEDNNSWRHICGSFTANGDEQYLIIGNFNSNQNMEYVRYNDVLIETYKVSRLAYYFIDHVELYEINDTLISNCENCVQDTAMPLIETFEGDLPRNSTLVLDNLQFDIDKASILPQSFDELDKLAKALRYYKTVRISINGHTDNTGGANHNMSLSMDRANAVRKYLIGKGISHFLIDVAGHGDTQPLTSNDTEEGRQINRRVEIKVLN